MPGSSMLANTACAGFMPSAWFTSSTPSRTKIAPPRPPCARRSGSSTAISRPIVAPPPRSARPPLWQSSIASSPAKPASSPSTAYSRGCMPTRRSCSRCSIGPRFRCTPTARKTTSAATSPDAKSQAAPAAISAETVATPSSPSPRPAPSSVSLFGITSGHGSPPLAQPSSRRFPSWSSPKPNRPDRHEFCPLLRRAYRSYWGSWATAATSTARRRTGATILTATHSSSTSTPRHGRPKGKPIEVDAHDFENKELGKVVPYGVYDVGANSGYVSLGIDHDTAQFAVNATRLWLDRMGRERYPATRKVMVTADCGGSNGPRLRLWKVELQRLADETGLTFQVCHYPPGTSRRVGRRNCTCGPSQNGA